MFNDMKKNSYIHRTIGQRKWFVEIAFICFVITGALEGLMIDFHVQPHPFGINGIPGEVFHKPFAAADIRYSNPSLLLAGFISQRAKNPPVSDSTDGIKRAPCPMTEKSRFPRGGDTLLEYIQWPSQKRKTAVPVGLYPIPRSFLLHNRSFHGTLFPGHAALFTTQRPPGATSNIGVMTWIYNYFPNY
jgi:hypothetical protein